jgi:hypothetical protein
MPGSSRLLNAAALSFGQVSRSAMRRSLGGRLRRRGGLLADSRSRPRTDPAARRRRSAVDRGAGAGRPAGRRAAAGARVGAAAGPGERRRTGAGIGGRAYSCASETSQVFRERAKPGLIGNSAAARPMRPRARPSPGRNATSPMRRDSSRQPSAWLQHSARTRCLHSIRPAAAREPTLCAVRRIAPEQPADVVLERIQLRRRRRPLVPRRRRRHGTASRESGRLSPSSRAYRRGRAHVFHSTPVAKR